MSKLNEVLKGHYNWVIIANDDLRRKKDERTKNDFIIDSLKTSGMNLDRPIFQAVMPFGETLYYQEQKKAAWIF